MAKILRAIGGILRPFFRNHDKKYARLNFVTRLGHITHGRSPKG